MSLKDDWKEVINIVFKYTDVCEKNEIKEILLRSKIINKLNSLRHEYGDVPIIIGTLAVYTDSSNEKLALFLQAFEKSIQDSDFETAISFATSSLQYCIENQVGKNETAGWRERVSKCLPYVTDKFEIQDAIELLNRSELENE